MRDLPFLCSEDASDTEMGPVAPSAIGDDEAHVFTVIELSHGGYHYDPLLYEV